MISSFSGGHVVKHIPASKTLPHCNRRTLRRELPSRQDDCYESALFSIHLTFWIQKHFHSLSRMSTIPSSSASPDFRSSRSWPTNFPFHQLRQTSAQRVVVGSLIRAACGRLLSQRCWRNHAKNDQPNGNVGWNSARSKFRITARCTLFGGDHGRLS
ncbi:hypothetical protein FRC03_001761 [Tulasnella sp. 419]|nr:hypothetical protein FRC03_001761 [Tulasnella sp. 419]